MIAGKPFRYGQTGPNLLHGRSFGDLPKTVFKILTVRHKISAVRHEVPTVRHEISAVRQKTSDTEETNKGVKY